MPETLEVTLWCAALATWLMLLFAFLSDGYKRFRRTSVVRSMKFSGRRRNN